MTADRGAPPAATDGLQPPVVGEESPDPGFGEKLIGWVGRFHPPATHFPIALLVAAALAELLGIVTRRPFFDSAARYCLWLGTLGALLTGVLGWFLGGFHLEDQSRLLTLHRWVGSAVALGACLLLALGERSRRHPSKRAIALAFRIGLLTVTLLVLAAGFLGGAMIYGLHQHEWR